MPRSPTPQFRTYAEMIAEANYPAVEGTYAVLAERLGQQRDEARAQADELADALDVAERRRSALAFKKARGVLHAYRKSDASRA